MTNEWVSEKLEHILCNYTKGRKVEPDTDLMAKPVSLSPHDMAALFLDIEKEFSIDLNQLVPELEAFSTNALAGKMGELYEMEIYGS